MLHFKCCHHICAAEQKITEPSALAHLCCNCNLTQNPTHYEGASNPLPPRITLASSLSRSLCGPPLLLCHASCASKQAILLLSTGTSGLSVIVAAGPYTVSDDLSYEPLQELLQTCHDSQPDVLILIGPFVDADHPLVASGSCEEPFEGIFTSKVGACIHVWWCRPAVCIVVGCGLSEGLAYLVSFSVQDISSTQIAQLKMSCISSLSVSSWGLQSWRQTAYSCGVAHGICSICILILPRIHYHSM